MNPVYTNRNVLSASSRRNRSEKNGEVGLLCFFPRGGDVGDALDCRFAFLVYCSGHNGFLGLIPVETKKHNTLLSTEYSP